MEKRFYKRRSLMKKCPAFQHFSVLVHSDLSGHKRIFQNNLRCFRDCSLIQPSRVCHSCSYVFQHKAYPGTVRLCNGSVHGRHGGSCEAYEITVSWHGLCHRIKGIRLQPLNGISAAYLCNPGLHRISFRILHLKRSSCQLVPCHVIYQSDIDRGDGILNEITEGKIVNIVIVLRLIYFKNNLLSAAVMACRSLRFHDPVHTCRHIRRKMRGTVITGNSRLYLPACRVNQRTMQISHILCRIKCKGCACLLCPHALIHTVFGDRHTCRYCFHINYLIIAVRHCLIRKVVRSSVRELRHHRIGHRFRNSSDSCNVEDGTAARCIHRNLILKI